MTRRQLRDAYYQQSRSWTQLAIELRHQGNVEGANTAGRLASFWDGLLAALDRSPGLQRQLLEETLAEINRVKTSPGSLAWARMDAVGTGTLTGDVSEVLESGANLIGSALASVGRGLASGLGIGTIVAIAIVAWLVLSDGNRR